MFTFCVLRCLHREVNVDALQRACKTLKKTVYRRLPRIEAAPEKTDCLTAIHYLVQNTMGLYLNLDRIGNMPRHLDMQQWKVVQITPEEGLKPGDLLFLGNAERLIAHVGMGVGPNCVFHSSREKRGGSLETLHQLFSRYHPLTDPAQMLSYKDPRPSVTLERASSQDESAMDSSE